MSLPVILLFWCAVLGLVIGSFLTVVAYRVPRGLSVVRPGSACPSCGAPVRAFDNVPVVSWLLLRGRCRDCGAAISARYPLMELATGALFAALGARLGAVPAVPAVLATVSVLAAVASVDDDHQDRAGPILTVGLAVVATLLLGAFVATGISHRSAGPEVVAGLLSVAGGIAAAVILRAAGGVDLRMGAMIGVTLGWLGGWPLTVGLVVGGGATGTGRGRRGVHRRDRGAPCLLAAVVVAVLLTGSR